MTFSNQRPNADFFICICWFNGSFLGGEHRGFLQEGVETFEWHQCRLLSHQLLFRLHIYSLCWKSTCGDTYGGVHGLTFKILSFSGEIPDWDSTLKLRLVCPRVAYFHSKFKFFPPENFLFPFLKKIYRCRMPSILPRKTFVVVKFERFLVKVDYTRVNRSKFDGATSIMAPSTICIQ